MYCAQKLQNENGEFAVYVLCCLWGWTRQFAGLVLEPSKADGYNK